MDSCGFTRLTESRRYFCPVRHTDSLGFISRRACGRLPRRSQAHTGSDVLPYFGGLCHDWFFDFCCREICTADLKCHNMTWSSACTGSRWQEGIESRVSSPQSFTFTIITSTSIVNRHFSRRQPRFGQLDHLDDVRQVETSDDHLPCFIVELDRLAHR